MYCPNCSAQLSGSNTSNCWNCGADFTAEDGWRPTERPLGKFREFRAKNVARQFPVPLMSGWTMLRYLLGAILLFAGYGTLILFILFLIFLFPKGTSSGSVLGLMMVGPPLAGAIVVVIILGHLIKPHKKPSDEST
jgi:hypothetical protein